MKKVQKNFKDFYCCLVTRMLPKTRLIKLKIESVKTEL